MHPKNPIVFFLTCLCLFVGANLFAQPTTAPAVAPTATVPSMAPATAPTTNPSDGDKNQTRYRLIKRMMDAKISKYRELEKQTTQSRMRLSQQVGPDLGVSRMETKLISLDKQKLETDIEYKKLQMILDGMHKAKAANVETREIVDAARADTRVQYLERRLEDAEIRLLTAIETKTAPTTLEAERDAIAKRLDKVLSERKKEAREQLLAAANEKVALAKAQSDQVNIQVDITTADAADLANEVYRLNRLVRNQEELHLQIRELEKELESMDMAVFSVGLETIWQYPKTPDDRKETSAQK